MHISVVLCEIAWIQEREIHVGPIYCHVCDNIGSL